MVSPTRLGGSPICLETRPLATYGTDSKGGRLRWTRRPAEPVPPAGDPGLARIRFGSTTQLAQQPSGRPRGPLTISKPHRPTSRRSYRRPLLQTEEGGPVAEDRPRTVAVLQIGRVDHSSQQQSRGSDHHLPFPITLLSTHSHEAPFCRDRLAVAAGDTERRVSSCQEPNLRPEGRYAPSCHPTQVLMHGLPRGQIVGDHSPRAPCTQDIESGIDSRRLTLGGLPPDLAAGRGETLPLAITQIAEVWLRFIPRYRVRATLWKHPNPLTPLLGLCWTDNDLTPDSSGAPHSKSDHQLAALATERGSTRRGPSGD